MGVLRCRRLSASFIAIMPRMLGPELVCASSKTRLSFGGVEHPQRLATGTLRDIQKLMQPEPRSDEIDQPRGKSSFCQPLAPRVSSGCRCRCSGMH